MGYPVLTRDLFLPYFRRELAAIAKRFADKYGMPRTIGAVDGFHVRVLAPAAEEWAFVNRKGEHSINTQVLIYYT